MLPAKREHSHAAMISKTLTNYKPHSWEGRMHRSGLVGQTLATLAARSRRRRRCRLGSSGFTVRHFLFIILHVVFDFARITFLPSAIARRLCLLCSPKGLHYRNVRFGRMNARLQSMQAGGSAVVLLYEPNQEERASSPQPSPNTVDKRTMAK